MILEKMAAFCPCPKSLPGTKVKLLRLIELTKEVSEMSSLDFVLWFTLMRSK